MTSISRDATATRARREHGRAPSRSTSTVNTARDVPVGYVPILDVVRGTAAGYQAVAMPTAASAEEDGPDRAGRAARARRVMTTALAAFTTLPTNTFISVPVPLDLLVDRSIRAALDARGDLSGIVLDITDFAPDGVSAASPALDDYRARGALISVGGQDTAQPELGSIVRLRPSIVRLGRAWVHDLDQSPAKRSAIEVTGRLAGQLDAWILAENVATAAELRTLSELGVPLAQGPFVGVAHTFWPDVELTARVTLPPRVSATDGVLRSLVQQAYTTRDLPAAQAVLPEATGFETVIVIDEGNRPVSLLEKGPFGRWDVAEILAVNVDTPVADAVARAMARPRDVRFLPLVCTDAAGRFVGILRIEHLMSHLVGQRSG